VTGTGGQHAVPMSVLSCVQRTREPLIVADATGDVRFARDTYFADIGACSLLAVPIVDRGALQAVLVLEHHLSRDAVTTERPDVVKLIAGQIAASLDNAPLYSDYRRIADEQAALRRVTTLVAQGPPPAAVFDAVAAEIRWLLDADGTTLGRFEPGDELTVVAHRGSEGSDLPTGMRFSHRMEHFEAAHGPIRNYLCDRGVRASAGAPIIVDGMPWGVAVAYWTCEESVPADTEERIGQLAKLLGTAIANADSREQLLTSRARLLAAGDEARRRVVRDLHDGAQQRLVHTIVSLKLAQRALQGNEADAKSLVDEALHAAEQGLSELRQLAHGILPAILTRGGLRAAVDAIVQRLDVMADVDIPDQRLPAEIEASAYFIVTEALTNIVKHARATRAVVSTSIEHGTLRVEVRDDGIGGADSSSPGLMGMSDRVAALRGRLELTSPPGDGTTVIATLPI
jgi:signal transduction histidine kinase